MLQTSNFTEQLKKQITELEYDCCQLCEKLLEEYTHIFEQSGTMLIIEFIRTKKGSANGFLPFEANYESYIEVGVEESGEYYPNAYIPIWKCREEMFQSIGYLTQCDVSNIEIKLKTMIKEMLQEIRENQEEYV